MNKITQIPHKFFLAVFVVFLYGSISSCKEEKEAEPAELSISVFTFIKGEEYDIVSFEDASTGGQVVTWSWDFGVEGEDTDVSDEQNPTYQFPDEGTYKVTLTVANEDGVENESTLEIVIAKDPVASFEFAIGEGDDYNVVSFKDLSSGGDAISWSWDFGVEGEDTDVSDEQNPTYQFPDEGTYQVTLIVANEDGVENESTLEIVIAKDPVASFEFAIGEGDDYNVVSFKDLSSGGDAISWSWDFDFDNYGSDIQNPTFSFPQGEGEYDVSLEVSNVNGLKSTFSKTVSITRIPEANFTYSTGVEVSDYFVVSFLDVSTGGEAVSWSWDFGVEGIDTDVSDLQNPTYTFPVGGANYMVSLTVENVNGVQDTYSSEISISQPVSILNGDFETYEKPTPTSTFDCACYGWVNTDIGKQPQSTQGYPWVHSGDFAIKLPADGSRVAYQVVEVVPNVTYTLEMYYLGEISDGSALRVRVLSEGITDIDDADGLSLVDSSFTGTIENVAKIYDLISIDFTATGSEIAILFTGVGEEYRIDDVSIVVKAE